MKTNILLVEPNYPIRYPNLALMKISAKHKKLGDNVRYVKGEHYFLEKIPHIIYISTMFTYYANETINCINFYKHNFRDAKIEVGGIFATLMPDYIIKKTNIVPKLGCFNDLDETIPDYSLIIDMIKFSSYVKKWEDFSILAKKNNLLIAPLFYIGKWEGEDFYYELANKPKAEGVIIRPRYEDRIKRQRLIIKFTNKLFKEKTKDEVDELKNKVNDYMINSFKDSCVLWECALSTRGIDKNEKKAFSDVMAICSERAMSEINTYLVDEFYLLNNVDITREKEEAFPKSVILNAMKKELPSVIKKLLKL